MKCSFKHTDPNSFTQTTHEVHMSTVPCNHPPGCPSPLPPRCWVSISSCLWTVLLPTGPWSSGQDLLLAVGGGGELLTHPPRAGPSHRPRKPPPHSPSGVASHPNESGWKRNPCSPSCGLALQPWLGPWKVSGIVSGTDVDPRDPCSFHYSH